MKVILGIGNPGEKYIFTRHNIGFQVLDRFAEKHKLNFKPSKGKFWFAESKLHTFPFYLVKPTTYVNNSGLVVLDLVENHKVLLKDILIIVDDLNLKLGEIRIRKSGGDGGHNGIKSIIYHLESDEFPRIRIGIGNDEHNENLAAFVLSEFTENELNVLSKQYKLLTDLMEQFITSGTNGMLDFYSNYKQTNNKKNNETGSAE